MVAYYNENDPAAAHILRALIDDGVVAPGHVDTRSIKEVMPDDLEGYTQCHFFAGGGLWSVAARLAGWPDARPLWTGSCPCQPFSGAGKGLGADDPRHLWPDFHRLISARRPAVVMGEQVAGKAGYGWFDGVGADLAGEDYASRAVDFPACSVDAPHQRNRLYWIATDGRLANNDRLGSPEIRRNPDEISSLSQAQRRAEHDAVVFGRGDDAALGYVSGAREVGALVHGVCSGLEGFSGHGNGGQGPQEDRPIAEADGAISASVPSDTNSHRCDRQGIPERSEWERRNGVARNPQRNGTYWSGAEWIACHDGKARRAEPDICFLVDGLPGRVDLWRVGGNAIVPEAAAEVIAAFMDTEHQNSTHVSGAAA